MWAPEMHKVNGKYLVYFTARAASNSLLSIGVASSFSYLGPFRDKGEPLLQNTTIPIGVIDATYYLDHDKHYLAWKVDGNDKGITARILIRELTDDGMDFVEGSEATQLIQNDLDWETICIEGPWIIWNDPYYYLFYAGNMYTSVGYAVGVARASSVVGPYTKFGPPILHTNFDVYNSGGNSTFVGPGHCSVVMKDDSWWIVYHTWEWGKVLKDPPGRVMCIDELIWSENWPGVKNGYPSTL